MQIVAGDHFSKLWIIICNMMSSIHLFANVCGGSISLQSVVMDAFVTILCCRDFLKTSSGLFAMYQWRLLPIPIPILGDQI